jgi:GNAT superfamily N-acetyltransferase
VVIGQQGDDPAGFALFFHTFSPFLGRPGIYLEDLYVKPEFRGMGIGRAVLVYLAGLAKERNCGRLEWSVHKAVQGYRRRTDGRVDRVPRVR